MFDLGTKCASWCRLSLQIRFTEGFVGIAGIGTGGVREEAELSSRSSFWVASVDAEWCSKVFATTPSPVLPNGPATGGPSAGRSNEPAPGLNSLHAEVGRACRNASFKEVSLHTRMPFSAIGFGR